jgi:hypothetical protein
MVTYQQYPSSTYPDFAQGNCYIVSSDLGLGLARWIRGRRVRFADEIMAGLYADGEGATRIMVRTDFKTDGGGFECKEGSVWHFDVGKDHMKSLWENDVGGRPQCEGF